jgi:hypothetical protein
MMRILPHIPWFAPPAETPGAGHSAEPALDALAGGSIFGTNLAA